MKKRFLGIVCLSYSVIIIYVWFFDKLKNFLAPNMQIYIKLSLIPLLIMSLVLLLNDHIHYKFKISDLVLFLPIILLICSGDGKLGSGFASKRVNQSKVKVTEEKVEVEEEEDIEVEADLSNIDYDIVDEVYENLSSYITYTINPDFYVGKTIRVRGLSLKSADFIPSNYYMLGKYAITCCAADAGFTGFIFKYNEDIKDNTWYEIEGVLKKGKDNDGYSVVYIDTVNIKEIDSDSEEQYIYPCYTYDDGSCSKLDNYEVK
mgnify:CR=1 FL=1